MSSSHTASAGRAGCPCTPSKVQPIQLARICLVVGCFAGLISQGLFAEDYPKVEISNKVIRAVVMLPDPAHGSYRATRFDWSGVIASLQFGGHQFVSRWYEHQDPAIHDSITGPAEEFLTSLGYDEAKPGGTFVRIGIGMLRKPDEKAFHRFSTYAIVDPGQWTIRRGKSKLVFTQRLKSVDGYGYVYRKTLRLVKGNPELLIKHSLKNTGSRVIDTDEYCHNFFTIDHEVVGPSISIHFPFVPKPAQPLEHGAAVRGHAIVYTRDLKKGDVVFSEMRGFGNHVSDFDARVENHKSGAGVRISGNRPLAKLLFWSIRTVACPETYLHLHIEPGARARWKLTYDFYEIAPPSSE